MTDTSSRNRLAFQNHHSAFDFIHDSLRTGPAVGGLSTEPLTYDETAQLDAVIGRATSCLASQQHPQGNWAADLQGDNTLEAEYILLRYLLGEEHDPDLPLLANFIRKNQTPSGGWSLYWGGADDVSATAKCYFALKLMGDDPNSPHMRSARRVVQRLGGADRCNSYTLFYFAALGQISWDVCPTIPPEIMLLPHWLYFSLYKVSAWTRTMIVPLSIVSTFRPVRRLPEHLGIGELFTGSGGQLSQIAAVPMNWQQIFLWIDQALKVYGSRPMRPVRQNAIGLAEQWLLDHMNGTGGLGAIFPPMVYILVVLRLLGYDDKHHIVQKANQYLRELFVRSDDCIRIQPCHSPVWDTAIATIALNEAGIGSDNQCMKRSIEWLLDREVRTASDWQRSTYAVEPSGWYFERDNAHYPDTDDTAMVLMALWRCRDGVEAAQAAIERGRNWLLAMQNRDGGWAAFDRTKDRPILEKVPFADHNAMQDPSCPDLTGRILEALGRCGASLDEPFVRRAVAFLQREQDSSGSWFGRWGVNYIYGTWQVLVGLKAVGVDMSESWVKRAADWLRNCQKIDGSWGETCDSYDDPSLKGQGYSTPSQTAWAVMGLLAADGPDSPAVRRGINWLIKSQRPDGNWDEPYFTGTGFPKVFYLMYHLYRLYFPLMALSRYRSMRAADEPV